MWFSIVIAALVCYFLGNHNGAICVSHMLGDDVRSHGSGNAGLTNFVRNYGIRRAVLVIAIDVGKAVLACLIAGVVLEPFGYGLEGRVLGGVCAMLGHDFPALQGFRGGKGVLSGWFIAWMVDWRIGLLIGVVFFGVYFITRYVSLGSVLAAIAFGISMIVLYWGNPYVMIGGGFMGALTVFQHRGNIVRLCKGQERKTNLLSKGEKT